MSKPTIICIDDQGEILDILERELAVFSEKLSVECCESAADAMVLINEIDSHGGQVALIISDQRMPAQSGVDFLTQITKDSRFGHTKKILLTGQASHEDTINAINLAKVDMYIEKPWQTAQLISKVKYLVTHFLFDQDLYEAHYQSIADTQVLLERLR